MTNAADNKRGQKHQLPASQFVVGVTRLELDNMFIGDADGTYLRK